MKSNGKPIFFDHSGKRWERLVRFIFWLTAILSVVGALFCLSILILPTHQLYFKSAAYGQSRIALPKLTSHEEAERRYIAKKTRRELYNHIRQEKARRGRTHANKNGAYSTTCGFYVNWETASWISVRDHIDSLTYVMPEWLYLTPDGKDFRSREILSARKGHDVDLRALAKAHNVPIIVMLDNVDKQTFQWDRLAALLKDPVAQRKLATKLRDYCLDPKNNFGGINLDLEPSIPADSSPEKRAEARKLVHDALPKFASIMHQVFEPAHLLVTEDLTAPAVVGPGNDFDYEALADANDFIVVMLYDLHVPYGDPGPIAPQDWTEQVAEKLFANVDSSKVVLGLSNICYDWPVKHDSKGYIVTGPDGRMKALPPGGKWYLLGQELRVASDAGAHIQMDGDELSPYFTYQDDHGIDHLVYIQDAVTAYNQIQALKGYEPKGVALWRLGSEDPAIWRFFDSDKLGKTVKLSDLETVKYRSEAAYDPEGSGEIFQITARPSSGHRMLKKNSDGLIVSEDYDRYPSEYIIRMMGDSPKDVALTFDDGPDTYYTPRILKILKEKKAPATFFVIGKYAEQHPSYVKACWDAGCDIGNHTFTHPRIGAISRLRAQMELNATQRTIESITGHSTKLFRPPYGDGSDSTPSADDVAILDEAQDFGYLTVGMNLDPKDYLRTDGVNYEKNGWKKIVDEVDSQLDDPKTKGESKHVILLHDGGGNRDQTLKALPRIIDDLRARGYHFVTVSGLLHGVDRDKIFPVANHKQEAIAGLDRAFFETSFALGDLLQIIFLLSIFLGLFRVLFVAPLALVQNRRSRKLVASGSQPPVTVIVPSYNEDRVVCRTIHSVLDSDYPDLSVLVIDDGSTDDTRKLVAKEFDSNPRVQYVYKENGGKASALNLGISMADSEIVVCLDADTLFAKDTISLLIPHFDDPKVGAVAGNVKVGNRVNPLTIWQSVEYITSQNFDRRAYAAMNSVAVVPGAVGAWRKSAVLSAGGYEVDTLAEDTDLTFRIRLLGYHVVTENRSLAFTEAPDSVRMLARQRFRWAYGTLQSLWKHRRATFNPKYGAFGMFVIPAMWIFNIFFQAFSPIVDIAVLLSLMGNEFSAVLSYYAAFFVIDLLGSYMAFRLDDEDPKQLVWLFWQRFFYRQFMYYIILKSIFAALKGGLVGWGKLHRKASVTVTDTKG